MNKYRSLYNTTLSLFSNLLLVTGCFIVCRLVFYWENHAMYEDMTTGKMLKILNGGLLFDISAILYTNLLYVALMLIPLHFKEGKLYQQIAKGIFVVTNFVIIAMNLMDTVYFQYTNRRTTATVFSEFSHENNLGTIFGTELINHWYLTLLAIAFGYILFRFYRKPAQCKIYNLPLYYLVHTATLALLIMPCIWGLRGGIGYQVRPITISNANQYVEKPLEAAIVLNTPFSIYRTFGKKTFVNPNYFKDDQRAEMLKLYSPLHVPADTVKFKPLNVVLFILESFGRENSGLLNPDLDNGTYKGYTPFLDSLMTQGLTYQYAFANGRKSIDGMPSALSGIPMFIEPYFLTPSSLNTVSSFAGELRKKGYYTAFFHGAQNGSMGFEAYARTSGFMDYFGRTEFNNDKYYDGTWGIWDEEFFQFYASKLSTFKQPFATGLFSLSSHHPFHVPERYEGVFPKGTAPVHQCIGYSDHALKLFFERVKNEPWFDNTLFVFTPDHANPGYHPEYTTTQGVFSIPLLFYQHNSNLKGFVNAIGQQIDIMPTVLSYLGYDQPYISFGCDLLTTPPEETFAVNYINGIYQFFKGDYLLQFDGRNVVGMYQFKTDRMLENNLMGKVPEQAAMENELKSIIQQYMERMNADELVVK